MGRLTTHVLDTAQGRPAAGMGVALYAVDAAGEERRLLKQLRTNADGRAEEPLLGGDELVVGRYEIVFAVGDYFTAQGLRQTTPPFLDQVPIRFGIGASDAHYHVPLLVSPWAYSTYRGS